MYRAAVVLATRAAPRGDVLLVMGDIHCWSISLGRWAGVHVRLHVSFVLFAVVVMYTAGQAHLVGHASLVPEAAVFLVILLVSVLLHEIGHGVAAARVGGGMDLIVLGPLGGLAPPDVPHEPHAQLRVTAAGPLVNLLLVLLSGLVLVAARTDLIGLLHPLSPASHVVEGSEGLMFMKLLFWTNWVLLLLNLLPVLLADGGRALRAVLWPVQGYRSAVLIVTRVAKLTALALCVAAWLMRDVNAAGLVPAWLPLLLLATLVFFNARAEGHALEEHEAADESFGYDFSQGYTSLERSIEPRAPAQPGLIRQWIERRRELKRRQAEELEEEEERRVDEILSRLHQCGMNGLSAEERGLLHRVSARYRNRHRG